MDRPKRLIAAKIAGLAGALGLAAAGPAPSPPLREARWLAPDADTVGLLLREPTECFAPSADPARAAQEEIGRAAFRTPTLLGGQAARAGLSCASCHLAGRGNPHFLFPGVSGAPGTADVTSSLFSTERGDGVANAAPIPDLSASKAQLKVSQAAPGELERFVRGLVVEEFAGAEPNAEVLAGLSAYLRALAPETCPSAEVQPVRPEAMLAEAARAARAAELASEAATRSLMLGAARAALGRLAERYPAADHAALRARLAAASQDLAQGRTALVLAQLPALEAQAKAALPGSYFEEGALRAALTAPAPSSQ